MKGYSRSIVIVFYAVMLTSANACGLPVDAAASEGLRVRWVMAGMPADAASPQPIRISPETTLRTGDKIKMYLEAVNECFFYLFHHGPEGRLRLVYPDALPAKMLASGTRLTVPRGDQWFELDENTGTETFYVLVSPAPLRSVETLYASYRQHTAENGDAVARLIAVIERLRHKQRPLTSKAERPVSIGGTFRGSPAPEAGTTERHLDLLAEDIATANVFCRTYTIEHR